MSKVFLEATLLQAALHRLWRRVSLLETKEKVSLLETKEKVGKENKSLTFTPGILDRGSLPLKYHFALALTTNVTEM